MFDLRAGRRGFQRRAGETLALLWLPFSGRKPALATEPVIHSPGGRYLCAHCLARVEIAAGAVAPRYCPECASTGEAWGLMKTGSTLAPREALERLLPALQYCFDLRQDNFSDLWGPDAPAQLAGIEAAIKDAAAALGCPEWRELG